MSRMVYVGGVDEVVVTFPSGRSVAVERGEAVELEDDDVAALADHPDWTPEEGSK